MKNKFEVEVASRSNPLTRELYSKLLELQTITPNLDIVQAHMQSIISHRLIITPALRSYNYEVKIKEQSLVITIDGIQVLRTHPHHIEQYHQPEKVGQFKHF